MRNFFRMLLICPFLLWTAAGVAADTITGTVRNQTTNQPAVGDEVVLLRLGQGMQQESRTKTNAQGAFTLSIASPNDPHVIQVSHQGVNYDQPLTGTGPVEVLVYNAAANVPGLRGAIGIAQLESNGKLLKVTEMYDISNTSNPPVTQVRPDNFEITIPPQAAFESVEARRGQGIWLKATPVPLKGQGGKYGLNFPIRPGETLFKFTYHLPYEGPTTLHIRTPYPTDKFGVMHPPTMTLRPLRAGTFSPPQAMPGNLRVEAAIATPVVGEVPAFEISGVGAAPEHGTASGAVPPAEAGQPSQASAVPPSASAPPASAHPAAAQPATADRAARETWLMVAGIVVILGGLILTLWRVRTKHLPVTTSARPSAQTPLLESLKEELFQLESNRVHGSISAEEYATTKQALTESIQRAMAKQP